VMTTPWTRVEPAVAPGGDVGGDLQATESYSVQFLPGWEPADGLHAMVTAYFYGAYEDPVTRPAGAPPEGFWVQQQTEFLICQDLDDPGGTEAWSDYRYYDWAARFPTAKEADRAARELAEQASETVALGWDGRATR
jgi:hypothetical protein